MDVKRKACDRMIRSHVVVLGLALAFRTSKHAVIHFPTWVPRLRLADRTLAAAVSLMRRLSLLYRSAREQVRRPEVVGTTLMILLGLLLLYLMLISPVPWKM